MAARAASSDRTARVMLEKRFGHLRASAVSRAEEEHDWSPPRQAPIRGPRSDHVEAQAGLESRSHSTQQVDAATHFDAVIGIAPVRGAASSRDDPCVAEASQMVRHKILRPTDELRQLADLPVASH